MYKFESVTKSLRWFVALLLVAFVAGCGGTTSSSPTVTVKTLKSIAVTPTSSSIPVSATQQFTATATYSDNSTSDVTTTASWTADSSGNATVGLHTGLAVGVTASVTPVVITASLGVQQATAALTVTTATLSSIAVTPASAVVAAGIDQQFAATATYSDNTHSDVTTTASWTADSSGNATVGLNTGLATGVTASVTPVVITAALGGQQATAALTVTAATLSSIAVTPASAVVAVGANQHFTATATYSDSTHSDVTTTASWTPDSSGNATVGSHTGIATGVTASVTPVVITAAFSGKQATAALTVSAAAGPSAIDLKSITTNNFVILATTVISEANPVNGAITGNIGLSPASGSAIGVTCAEMQVASNIHASNASYTGSGDTTCAVPTSPVVAQAILDLGSAYTAASDPATPAGVGATNLDLLAGNIPLGTIFVPGTYTWGSDLNINGDIHLNGGASDVWVFQISGNLNLASGGSILAGTHVILSGGALASNVFWQVAGASATLGTYSTFNGIILTSPSTLIAIQTGAVLHGRALSGTAVTLDGNVVGP